jgi:hypothetical protein
VIGQPTLARPPADQPSGAGDVAAGDELDPEVLRGEVRLRAEVVRRTRLYPTGPDVDLPVPELLVGAP